MKSEPESVSYESRYSRLQYSSFVIFVGMFPLAFNSGTDVKDAQVICVSTGTKCINGEYMSDRGLALNDCHAEIIARRSLIRYLYMQLEHFLRWDAVFTVLRVCVCLVCHHSMMNV